MSAAVRYVQRWMDTASACWPCVGRAEIARLAGLGVQPRTFVLRLLSIVHYSLAICSRAVVSGVGVDSTHTAQTTARNYIFMAAFMVAALLVKR